MCARTGTAEAGMPRAPPVIRAARKFLARGPHPMESVPPAGLSPTVYIRYEATLAITTD